MKKDRPERRGRLAAARRFRLLPDLQSVVLEVVVHDGERLAQVGEVLGLGPRVVNILFGSVSKLFFLRHLITGLSVINLLWFVISYSICPWQPSPA